MRKRKLVKKALSFSDKFGMKFMGNLNVDLEPVDFGLSFGSSVNGCSPRSDGSGSGSHGCSPRENKTPKGNYIREKLEKKPSPV